MSPAALERWNALPAAQAAAEIRACCGATAWAQALAGERPFADLAAAEAAAERIWRALPPEDWREAFAAHPPIGENATATSGPAAQAASWSAAEQAGAANAAVALLAELAGANRDYEAHFGHVFLICATGKSAAEMLAALRARMGNSPQVELAVAAAEQLAITRLRLARFFS